METELKALEGRGGGKMRWLSTRDLMKWCHRVESLGYASHELHKSDLRQQQSQKKKKSKKKQEESEKEKQEREERERKERERKEMGTIALKVRETVFQEAVDCFCASIMNNFHRNFIIRKIGLFWNLSEERIVYCCDTYKSSCNVTEMDVTLGRVSLPVVKRKSASEVFILFSFLFFFSNFFLSFF